MPTEVTLQTALAFQHCMVNIKFFSQGGEAAGPNLNGITNTVAPEGVSMTPQQGWKQETLHPVPSCTEVPPSLYEELKLGQDGVGFKRLKP